MVGTFIAVRASAFIVDRGWIDCDEWGSVPPLYAASRAR